MVGAEHGLRSIRTSFNSEVPSNGLAGLYIKLDSLVGRIAQYRLIGTSARLFLKRSYSAWRFLLDDNTNGTLVIFGGAVVRHCGHVPDSLYGQYIHRRPLKQLLRIQVNHFPQNLTLLRRPTIGSIYIS